MPSFPTQSLADYIRQVIEKGGSDLHLAAGSPPIMRLHGELERMTDVALADEETRAIILPLLSDDQRMMLFEFKNLDFAYEIESRRLRVNAYFQKKGLDAVFRIIPSHVPTLAELDLPEVVAQMTRHHQGLVLVTGPAGCGKTTTLAAMINQINAEQPRHIITIEDPIEYIHQPNRSLINQRQVGRHAESFSRALRAAVREDPDVVLVGELRDLETIQLAITASETGHLVLGTLHTSSAAKTIDRIIDAFPVAQQPQIRMMISDSLRGVISQQLLPRADGPGRVLAVEVLVGCVPVANMIRDSKTFQLPSLIQTGRNLGMRPMDDSIQQLLQEGVITKQTAIDHATDLKALRLHLMEVS